MRKRRSVNASARAGALRFRSRFSHCTGVRLRELKPAGDDALRRAPSGVHWLTSFNESFRAEKSLFENPSIYLHISGFTFHLYGNFSEKSRKKFHHQSWEIKKPPLCKGRMDVSSLARKSVMSDERELSAANEKFVFNCADG